MRSSRRGQIEAAASEPGAALEAPLFEREQPAGAVLSVRVDERRSRRDPRGDEVGAIGDDAHRRGLDDPAVVDVPDEDRLPRLPGHYVPFAIVIRAVAVAAFPAASHARTRRR